MHLRRARRVRRAGRRARRRSTRSSSATDDDTAVLLYTSGTTGSPKGAELTHAQHDHQRRCSARRPCVELEPRRRRDGLPAAVPLLRADLRAQRVGAVRRVPDAGPAVRRGEGARGDRPRPGHGVRGRADDVRRDAATRRTGSRTTCPACAPASPAGRDAGRGDEGLRGGVRLHGARGLRAVRDLAGGVVQPARHRAQARLDRHPGRGRRDEAASTTTATRSTQGERRRDRDRGRERHEGLLGRDGRHRGGDHGRLVPHRRHGQAGRGRLLLHRRPQEGPDHPRRLQRLPARGRGGALRAPGGRRGRRHRHPARRPGRGGRRRRRAQGGQRRSTSEELQRLRQGAAGRLQVPAARLDRRRAAEGPDRQDPAPRGRGARRGEPRRRPDEQPHEVEDERGTDAATPLDLLLADAASSPLRRFLPGMSGVRFTASLARQPGRVVAGARGPGRRAGPDRRRALRDRAPHEKDRRFADEALDQEPAPPAHSAEPTSPPGRRRGAWSTTPSSTGATSSGWASSSTTWSRRRPPATTRCSTRRCSSASIDTGGGNLVDGGRRFVRDFADAAAGAVDGRARRVRGRRGHRGDAGRGRAAHRRCSS